MRRSAPPIFRLVGAECAGTSSLNTPTFKLPPRRRKPRQVLLSDFGWFDKPQTGNAGGPEFRRCIVQEET